EPEACHLLGHPIYPLDRVVVSEPDQQAEAPADRAGDPAADRDRRLRYPLQHDAHGPPPGTAGRAIIVQGNERIKDRPGSHPGESIYLPKTVRSQVRMGPGYQACIAPAPHRPDPAAWPDDRLTVSWLGHATVLLNLVGSSVVTDPVLEPRIGVGRGRVKLGPRRLVQPALRKRELPRLDAVLLSHAHMDHTDLGTLRAIPPSTRVVVQSGNRDLVRRFHEVDELAWGERTRIGALEVESVETRHWGARMVTDRYRGWGGYLLRKRGLTVLFGGDTAYTDALDHLGRRARIDLAILPIGAYDPWISNHASPEEAW